MPTDLPPPAALPPVLPGGSHTPGRSGSDINLPTVAADRGRHLFGSTRSFLWALAALGLAAGGAAVATAGPAPSADSPAAAEHAADEDLPPLRQPADLHRSAANARTAVQGGHLEGHLVGRTYEVAPPGAVGSDSRTSDELTPQLPELDDEVAGVTLEGQTYDAADAPAGEPASPQPAADPEHDLESDDQVYVASDGTVVDEAAIRSFLDGRDAPLADQAATFVAAGVEHDVDPRLPVAISIIESGGGKAMPSGSHNPWGWSGSGPSGLKAWGSWDEAINDYTERLGRLYDTKNVDMDFASTYCPPNAERWLEVVTWSMGQMGG